MGGKADSILPAGDTIIMQLQDDPCLPASGSSQRLPNCLSFISAVGFKLAEMMKHLEVLLPTEEKLKYFVSSYEPETIFLAEKAVCGCHIKPQPKLMCSQQK